MYKWDAIYDVCYDNFYSFYDKNAIFKCKISFSRKTNARVQPKPEIHKNNARNFIRALFVY